MKQKTVYTPNNYEVGAEVLLYSRTYIKTGEETFKVSRRYAAEGGYPCALNRDLRKTHGWCGTCFEVATDTYGVRRVKSCTPTDKEDIYGDTIYKVVVGEDIHPDWK